ncbi:MAG: hypothetical protein J6K72_03325 [Clostridia bacterium]|nr:hypothetical protein [Clostridia bacterium]
MKNTTPSYPIFPFWATKSPIRAKEKQNARVGVSIGFLADLDAWFPNESLLSNVFCCIMILAFWASFQIKTLKELFFEGKIKEKDI